MGDNTVRVLFIAPSSNLAANAELARIASGLTLEIVDGMLDRSGLERALRDPYDAVHFVGHGEKSILELTTERLDAADLVSMLGAQHGAKFFFLNTCDSLAVGTAIHNALHVPIVVHDARIDDKAAVHFATVFYRRYRQNQRVSESFDAARDSLLRQYPTQAAIPQLINGDMATQTQIDDCMRYLQQELGGVFDHFNARLDKQDARLGQIETMLKRDTGNNSVKVIIALLAVLAALQLLTPIANGLLVR